MKDKWGVFLDRSMILNMMSLGMKIIRLESLFTYKQLCILKKEYEGGYLDGFKKVVKCDLPLQFVEVKHFRLSIIQRKTNFGHFSSVYVCLYQHHRKYTLNFECTICDNTKCPRPSRMNHVIHNYF